MENVGRQTHLHATARSLNLTHGEHRPKVDSPDIGLAAGSRFVIASASNFGVGIECSDFVLDRKATWRTEWRRKKSVHGWPASS